MDTVIFQCYNSLFILVLSGLSIVLSTVLPYITLGVTEGVDTNSVSFDEYVSQLISVEFPLGLQVQSTVQVQCNT